MSRIDVAFAPAKPDDASVAVVIDVLRATTTIAYALAQGYERVLACGDIDQARELARRVNGGAVLAGERECVKPEGFDLGNSPREFEGPALGTTLVITTTNGTRAIVTAAAHAETVAIGSLANLTSCAARVGRAAEAIARGFESAGDGLAASKSARNLRDANLLDDVRFCARESALDVVPMVADVDAGVALITAAPSR
ncbi:MAG: 2-phosphosulfolactate phosphatase [Gaiellales bacterium]|nr:2-phosphosulfolactate phosphatase [Gaiellales bacterium]